jgi:hypothetical protein
MVMMVLAGVSQAASIVQDDFSGLATDLLNGQGADLGGTWSANFFARADGSINGAYEGSAILGFTAEAGMTYTLKMDVINPSGQWVALGFKNSALRSPGGSTYRDRFTNGGGNAWMLFAP